MTIRARLLTLCFTVLISAPAIAANHALIMTIGDYPPVGVKNIPNDLMGPPTDAGYAATIARKLGIPPTNIKVLRDAQVSHDAITRELKTMAARVSPNDQVFIYFSGHGAQIVDKTSEKASGCTEGLVTHENSRSGFLADREFKSLIDGIAAKSSKVIAFVDACHSGAIAATRGFGTGNFIAKVHGDSAPASQCGKPVNYRSFAARLQAGRDNVAVVSAAAPDEVALDGGERIGGLATSMWLQCLTDPEADTNHSGGLSAEELRVCAQVKIQAALKGSDYETMPQHVTITGNKALVMAFADQAPPAEAPPAPVAAASPPPAISTTAAANGSPQDALMDIYNSRDPKWRVTLTSPKASYKIRQERVELEATSDRDGYLYLILVGSSNKGYLLFPNEFDQNNAVKSGQKPPLPRTGWKITPGGPAGTDYLLAMLTSQPVKLDDLPLPKAGAFKSINLKAATLAKLQQRITRDLLAEDDSGAANAYGAAVLKINEVE
ncbi:MAG: caspase family protein [Sulfuricellaceae bacterium]